MGLINSAVADDQLSDKVDRIARQIAVGPTAAFSLSKRLVARMQAEALDFDAILEAEAIAQGTIATTTDYAEGISAFQQKRNPKFSGS